MASDNGGSVSKLTDQFGKALIPEPRLIVLKQAPGVKVSPQVIQGLGQTMKCTVLVLPMDAELIMGHVARSHIDAIHSSIHQALGLPQHQQ